MMCRLATFEENEALAKGQMSLWVGVHMFG